MRFHFEGEDRHEGNCNRDDVDDGPNCAREMRGEYGIVDGSRDTEKPDPTLLVARGSAHGGERKHATAHPPKQDVVSVGVAGE